MDSSSIDNRRSPPTASRRRAAASPILEAAPVVPGEGAHGPRCLLGPRRRRLTLEPPRRLNGVQRCRGLGGGIRGQRQGGGLALALAGSAGGAPGPACPRAVAGPGVDVERLLLSRGGLWGRPILSLSRRDCFPPRRCVRLVRVRAGAATGAYPRAGRRPPSVADPTDLTGKLTAGGALGPLGSPP